MGGYKHMGLLINDTVEDPFSYRFLHRYLPLQRKQKKGSLGRKIDKNVGLYFLFG